MKGWVVLRVPIFIIMLVFIILLPAYWDDLALVSSIKVSANVDYYTPSELQEVVSGCLHERDLRRIDRFSFEVCVSKKLPILRDMDVRFWDGKMWVSLSFPQIVFGVRSAESGTLFYYSGNGNLYPARWFLHPPNVPVYVILSPLGESGKTLFDFLDDGDCSLMVKRHSPAGINVHSNGQIELLFKIDNGVKRFIFSKDTLKVGCRMAMEHWDMLVKLQYTTIDLTYGGIIVVKDDRH